MFIHYRTQGFIFKKTDRGEADQLLSVYAKDFGRIEIMAKAVRKISSKLRQSSEIFCFSEIEFVQGKKYKILTDAILINNFKIKKELTKSIIGFKICRVLDVLIKGEEFDLKIWELLKSTFSGLNNSSKQKDKFDPEFIYYYFFWKLFFLLGYRPEIYSCLICQKKLLPEKLYFDFVQAGVICQNCSKELKLKTEINIQAIKTLRIIFEKEWDFFVKLKFSKDDLDSLRLISENYFSQFLNKQQST